MLLLTLIHYGLMIRDRNTKEDDDLLTTHVQIIGEGIMNCRGMNDEEHIEQWMRSIYTIWDGDGTFTLFLEVVSGGNGDGLVRDQ
jgi:hypothetical protein